MHSFLKNLHPHLSLEKISSKYNNLIEVYSEFGHPRITVDSMPQSGGIVTDILKKSLNHFHHPQNFLLLGLGGGDILHHIHYRWPDCQLTAVEIDPAMITIAQKYFNVDQIANLQIINTDAYRFVTSSYTSPKRRKQPSPHGRGQGEVFDAILVDCYLGHHIPPQLESPEFLNSLKKILSPSGTIAFNRLYDQKQTATHTFTQNLKKILPLVSQHRSYCNQLIIAKLNPSN